MIERLHARDLDGDGHPELVFTDVSFRSVGIVPGPIVQTDFLSLDPGALRWQLSVSRNSLDDPFDVCLGDFNGDGFDDVAVATVREPFGIEHGVVQIVHGATPPAP